MGFSAKQVRLLQRHIHPRHLRSREANGRELTYIEGWHAIDEANRIFGFDGWDRETLESRCIAAREVHGVFRALYAARVRIRVRAEGVAVVREGSGTGEGRGTSSAEAHDVALKSAETDATKRALATFGKPFGLALYLKAKRPNGQSAAPPTTSARSDQPMGAAKPQRTGAMQASSAPNGNGRREASSLPPPKEALAIRRDLSKPPFISSLAPKALQTSQPLRNGEATNNPPSADVPALPTRSQSEPSTSQENPLATATPSNERLDPVRDDDRTQIDKSVLTHGAARRYRDKVHLRFVATQPCLICSGQPADAHHLRFAQPRSLGRKVSDQFTVPLCRLHHRELHQAGKEQDWWEAHSIDPLPVAQELWSESRSRRLGGTTGDHDLASPDRSPARERTAGS